MTDFADQVARLVAQPGYKPITLKAMARRFEVPADDYAAFPSNGS
jgi:ribonuclease R